MNPLQSGTPASAITPQGYKNSSQNSSFQDTYSSSNIQQTGNLNQNINTLSGSGDLVVVDAGSSSVLGSSTSESYSVSTNLAVAQPKTNYVPINIVIVVVSLALALYFYNRYKNLAPVSVDEEE